MERKHVGLLAVVLALLVAAIPVSAHHSFAAVFDANQPVTVKGIVTEVRLENPHSWFFIEARDASGKVEKWAFEGSTPTSLLRSGVKPGFVKAGDEVTIKFPVNPNQQGQQTTTWVVLRRLSGEKDMIPSQPGGK